MTHGDLSPAVEPLLAAIRLYLTRTQLRFGNLYRQCHLSSFLAVHVTSLRAGNQRVGFPRRVHNGRVADPTDRGGKSMTTVRQ